MNEKQKYVVANLILFVVYLAPIIIVATYAYSHGGFGEFVYLPNTTYAGGMFYRQSDYIAYGMFGEALWIVFVSVMLLYSRRLGSRFLGEDFYKKKEELDAKNISNRSRKYGNA